MPDANTMMEEDTNTMTHDPTTSIVTDTGPHLPDHPSAPTDVDVDHHDESVPLYQDRPSSEHSGSPKNHYEKLSSIKAFTEAQLLSLHPDIAPSTSLTYGHDQQQLHSMIMDEELYELLYELEKSIDHFAVTRDQINQAQRKSQDIREKVWDFQTKSVRKIEMCQQGRICEVTFKYKQASLNQKELDRLKTALTKLKDGINEDYISYSFTCQIKRYQIISKLISCIETADLSDRMAQLRSSITALFTFIRHLNNTDSDYVQQCRDWLRKMLSSFLKTSTTEDYLFVIAQIVKGPMGISDWISDLLVCESFNQTGGFESVPSYISHCLSLLTAILSPKRTEINLDKKKLQSLQTKSDAQKDVQSDEPDSSNNKWLYIDPQFEHYGEELDINSSNGPILSEVDIITLCQQIPVTKIFRDYTRTCMDNEFRHDEDRNDEVLMLKLLAIATRILNNYQLGLSTFNSIQYNNLVEYLSLQIRHTVLIISSYWQDCKRRLITEKDNALLMRLEVEYDHFILRSIITILELRRSGIWQHLSDSSPEDPSQTGEVARSVDDMSQEYLTTSLARLLRAAGKTIYTNTGSPSTVSDTGDQVAISKRAVGASKQRQQQQEYRFRPANSLTYGFSIEWFHNVSDPMMWHILWQFHNNCRDKKAAFSSFCKYYNDAYWRKKFQETAVLYLFTEKFLKLPTRECHYLLNSLSNMILSRSNPNSEFVTSVTTEIFDVSFRCNILKTKVTKTGIQLLASCAEKFPTLMSLYIKFFVASSLPDEIVDLFDRCTLNGWICEPCEYEIITNWLKNYPLASNQNRVARLLLTKLLLNDSDRTAAHQAASQESPTRSTKGIGKKRSADLSLAFRRNMCLLICEASEIHLPQGQMLGVQSLGTSVEVALDKVYEEHRASLSQLELCTLARSDVYQQYYIWSWRLLLSLRVHILDQPGTDWNSVQSRSGTSRSVMNTVLIGDLFHPVPSLQDVECLSLAQSVEANKPMALYAYMMLTDVLWQRGLAPNCLRYLNILAGTGHLTPSLVAWEYLMICHIEDLESVIVKDGQTVQYMLSVILSNIEESRVSSLVLTQMLHLTQYRQLQLMRAYIKIFLEVTALILKQISSYWFNNDSIHLRKMACLFDNMIRFNFASQRQQFIRIICDCSYSVQNWKLPSFGWFSSMFNSGSFMSQSTRKEFITLLHVLAQKYKHLVWLRWAVAESDTIRLEKIWEDIVSNLSSNQEATVDSAIKKKCPHLNQAMIKSILPINSWIGQALDINEIDVGHPICPLIWYNFFLNYFANSLNGSSVGLKVVAADTLQQLRQRLDSLFNYHYRQWTHSGGSDLHSQLAKLYKAYMLWLQDKTLQDAYVDLEHLGNNYLVSMLKSIMQSSDSAWLPYVNMELIEEQNGAMARIWPRTSALIVGGASTVANNSSQDGGSTDAGSMLIIDEEASDVVSLLVSRTTDDHGLDSPPRSSSGGGEPVANKLTTNNNNKPGNKQVGYTFEEFPAISKGRLAFNSQESGELTVDRMSAIVKENFDVVFAEAKYYGKRITRLTVLCDDLVKLMADLYTNKRRELQQLAPCSDGAACTGPAKITLSVEEATASEQVQARIDNNKEGFHSIVHDLLELPTNALVAASLTIEQCVERLVNDANSIKFVIEDLLTWISEPSRYEQLGGAYQPASYLLNTILELMSNTNEIDVFNRVLLNVCFQHPHSVHIFSPKLAPSACTSDCFAQLYQSIEHHLNRQMPPLAIFVILSKFDVALWLRTATPDLHRQMIRTICSSFVRLGMRPDEEFLPSFELFRRHLQAVMTHRYPAELSLTMSQMLATMDKLELAPDLWTDYLLILGFYTSFQWPNELLSASNQQRPPPVSALNLCNNQQASQQFDQCAQDNVGLDSTLTVLVEELVRLADNQASIEWAGLNELMGLISKHFDGVIAKQPGIILLDHYRPYTKQFIVVMASVSFMWIKSTASIYPNNHSYIWNQLIELWQEWIYLDKSCQNIQKHDYRFVLNIFVACLQYLIEQIPDNTSQILSSIWGKFRQYVIETRAIIYLELSIMQQCLCRLPWNKFLMQAVDFQYLSDLIEQENYQVYELTSHILLQVDWRESLRQLRDDPNLPQVMARLAAAIIRMSSQLRGFKLPGQHFNLIPSDQVKQLAQSILPRMEFVNLEHSQSNKLLVNLLRSMTIHFSDGTNIMEQPGATVEQLVASSSDSFDKQLIYAQFISAYLVDLITGHQSVVQSHRHYIKAVLDNSLRDLSWSLLSSGVSMDRKQALLSGLLNCCNQSTLNEEARMTIAECLVEASLFRQSPVVVIETIRALGNIVNDATLLVYTMERLIEKCFALNGHYEKLWKSFSLTTVPVDLFLDASIQLNSALTLLIYFEAQMNDISEEKTKVWAEFLHWASQLNASSGDELSESKVVAFWMRAITLIGLSCPRASSTGGGSQSDNNQQQQQQQHYKKQANNIIEPNDYVSGNIVKTIMGFNRHLVYLFDTYQSGNGLWSILRSSKDRLSQRSAIIALGLACYSMDKISRLLPQDHDLYEEAMKDRRQYLARMESCQKSKTYQALYQTFIDGIIESVNHSDRVEFIEGLQLISGYIRSYYSDNNIISKILIMSD